MTWNSSKVVTNIQKLKDLASVKKFTSMTSTPCHNTKTTFQACQKTAISSLDEFLVRVEKVHELVGIHFLGCREENHLVQRRDTL